MKNMTKRKNHRECRFGALLAAITISTVVLQPVASADDAAWDGGGADALWSNTSNWGGVAAVPGIGNTATFNAAAGAGGAVIDLGGGVTVRQIGFDTASVAAYTIGSGALTLGDAANTGKISVASTVGNNQTFTSAITLGSSGATTGYRFENAATAQILTFNGNITGGSGGTAGTKTLTINAAGEIAVNGAISTGGATTVALVKEGSGTLTLGGVNSYSGTTTVSAGTLVLNVDASLATTGTLNFSGSSTFSLAGNQTLVNVTVANSQTGTVTGGGGLTLNGGTFTVGGSAANTFQTLNLSGLGSFTYNGGGAVSVGGQLSGNNTRTIGTLTLPNNSTITASTFGVANVSNGGNSSQANNTNLGTLNLTGSTTINTGAITLGANQATAVLQYSGATNPTLKLRAVNGTDAVTTMTVGLGGGNGNAYTMSGTVDLVTGVTGTSTLDASVGTLRIGYYNRAAAATSAGGTINGTFTMGAGTLTVTTMTLGQTGFYGTTATGTASGTFTTGSGGVVQVTTLNLVDKNNTNGAVNVTGTFNLNGGADLYAQTIQPGGNGTSGGSATRQFNWNNGTIHNLAGTNLTVSSGLTLTMATGATHAFNIDNGQTGTVSAAITGASQALTKAGAGTLVLAGAISYTGSTAINDGTLTIDTSGSQTLSGDISGSGALVKNGIGTLTLGGSNTYSGDTTVNDGTLIVGNGKLPSSTSLRIAASGMVDLAGSNTVRRLYIGGAGVVRGVWGSASSGAANTDSHFSGTGTLTVTESGENIKGTLLIIQ